MHTNAAKELTVSGYHCRCVNVLTSHSTAKRADANKPLFLPQTNCSVLAGSLQHEEHGVRLPHHDVSENCFITPQMASWKRTL